MTTNDQMGIERDKEIFTHGNPKRNIMVENINMDTKRSQEKDKWGIFLICGKKKEGNHRPKCEQEKIKRKKCSIRAVGKVTEKEALGENQSVKAKRMGGK